MEEPPLREVLKTSELPPVAASVRTARHELLPMLAKVFTPDEQDVAALLISELVANAILHADAPIHFTASLTPRCLRVEVCDASTTLPRVREPDADSGRRVGVVRRERSGVAVGSGAHRRREAGVVRARPSSNARNRVDRDH
jgi:anti-sigma regulatory factor (Ser/Thr protein kinase)